MEGNSAKCFGFKGIISLLSRTSRKTATAYFWCQSPQGKVVLIISKRKEKKNVPSKSGVG